jgi:hypothetical protein
MGHRKIYVTQSLLDVIWMYLVYLKALLLRDPNAKKLSPKVTKGEAMKQLLFVLCVLLVSSPTEKSPTRWNRKTLIAGSMGGDLALIATVVVLGLISAQTSDITESNAITAEEHP